jgi:hypothetical protein
MTMAHYAFLDENNVVTHVIPGVDETDLIEGKDPEVWYGQFVGQTCKRTSYNTRGGTYWNPETGKKAKDQSKAFRLNYAGIGFEYREDIDGFVPPQPFPSWALNEGTGLWESPVPLPTEGGPYQWDEDAGEWVTADISE